ncbi:hypothetical protein [Paenibacillus spongiae]|uniref:Membrane-spanning protein n=1 Tax=Paenibacillus spongiae TaxID=2909671 RepID=A0ABY5SH41_9BACL|nr:hypothetical protein [Paenibacillus spongiae]UVI33294.1 hypothetical protein L1F29_16245 [Paenibacillus spongiae]
MSRKKKQQFNAIFEIGLYAVCILSAVYYTLHEVYAKSFQAILTLTVLLLIRGMVRWTKTELFPTLRFSVLFFVALAMLIGNLFGFYGVIPYLDKIEHLLSGVILCFIGLLVIRKMIQKQGMSEFPPPIAVWFSLFFAVAMAGCWEIYEFTVDRLFGLNSQNGSLTDTMLDILCGTAGAAGTALFLAYRAKRHPLSILASDEARS